MSRLVCISDMHNQLDKINVPEGDILVCSGDATMRGQPKELIKFNNDLGSLQNKFKHILFTPGNHDLLFEKDEQRARSFITNATILIDEEINIDGIKFYGSPWQPFFYNWAFNLPRGKALEDKWSKIPDDTEVLITHGPPHMILDVVPGGQNVGCEALTRRVGKLDKLALHCFGHIHFSYGSVREKGALYVNASSCTEGYLPNNPPIIIDI